jgi:hypothetical protein
MLFALSFEGRSTQYSESLAEKLEHELTR